jgi:hypothetical protein
MGQLDGIAVGLRGCPRPIEWSKERQDGDQEQEHEVGQCDSVVGVFFLIINTKEDFPLLCGIKRLRIQFVYTYYYTHHIKVPMSEYLRPKSTMA